MVGEIAAVVFVKALVVGLWERATGQEMFPANPKGPLYKWFGKPSSGSPE